MFKKTSNTLCIHVWYVIATFVRTYLMHILANSCTPSPAQRFSLVAPWVRGFWCAARCPPNDRRTFESSCSGTALRCGLLVAGSHCWPYSVWIDGMDGWDGMGWDGTGWDGCMHLPIWLSMYLCIYVSTRMYLYTSVVCIRNSLWNPVDSFIHGMNYLMYFLWLKDVAGKEVATAWKDANGYGKTYGMIEAYLKSWKAEDSPVRVQLASC